MTTQDDAAAIVADAQDDADFASGFPDKSGGKPGDKPAEPESLAPEGATKEATETPEYVKISAKDWAEVRAAAAKTAGYDQQLSKAFGTIGNLQKLVNGFQGQAPSAGRKIEISKDAFAEMARDFPELAELNRAAMEKALSNMPGTGAAELDPDKIEAMLAAREIKREIRTLEEDYPDWRTLVGAVDVTQGAQPDPNNPFRRWLGTQPPAYQARLNASESAAVIGSAIAKFQAETKGQPKTPAAATPRDEARAERIRGAVQPRGDNAGAGAAKTDDDAFLEGFNSR